MKLPEYNTSEKISNKKESVHHISFLIILCISVVGISICIGKLFSMWNDDKAANSLIVEFEPEQRALLPNVDSLFGNTVTEQNPEDPFTLDWESAKQTTSDSVTYSYDKLAAQVPATAYIRIPDTSIQYPVMHSTEDGYYLNHAADGSKNRNGAIYLASENSPTLTDPINYIFGHNMRSGLMFSSLNNYLNASFLSSHPDCYLVTEKGTLHYTLFYAASVSPETQIKRYNEAALGTDTYASYMAELSTMTGHTLDAEDKLIVLITCTNANRKNRTIVYGYLN